MRQWFFQTGEKENQSQKRDDILKDIILHVLQYFWGIFMMWMSVLISFILL